MKETMCVVLLCVVLLYAVCALAQPPMPPKQPTAPPKQLTNMIVIKPTLIGRHTYMTTRVTNVYEVKSAVLSEENQVIIIPIKTNLISSARQHNFTPTKQ